MIQKCGRTQDILGTAYGLVGPRVGSVLVSPLGEGSGKEAKTGDKSLDFFLPNFLKKVVCLPYKPINRKEHLLKAIFSKRIMKAQGQGSSLFFTLTPGTFLKKNITDGLYICL